MVCSPGCPTRERDQPACHNAAPGADAPLTASGRGRPSEKGYRLGSVLLRRIIPRCVIATSCTLGGAGALPLPAAAPQGPQSDNPLQALLESEREARALTPAEAMAAYMKVADWVKAWDVPVELVPGSVEPAAARVVLFRSGAPVGEGSALREGSGRGVVWRAASAAMAGAEREMVPRRDALWREQMHSAAAGLTLSVELAGPMTPLGEAELADPDSALRPGLDGLAIRHADAWEVVFPAELAALGVTPTIELAARAAKLLGDPAAGVSLPRDLAIERGVVFYRFGVSRIAGVGRAGAPEFLTRGGRVVELSDVDVASLLRFAEGLLGHFEQVRHPDESGLGLWGTIHPFRGVADPPLATPTQQSLAALSLVNLARTPQASEAVRARAEGLARSLMRDLQRVEGSEIAPEDDGVACALAWVALRRLGAAGDASDGLRPLFETCERMMDAHARAERGETRGTVSEAILAWAMAERAGATGLDRDAAERDVRALYRATEPGALVGLMPWLGWAELALCPEGPVPAGPALRQIRERVWEHQLAPEDTGPEERDLAGGIVFTRGFVSLPTWSSARAVAFCATMLGDPRLTTREELSPEIVRLLASMRFLMQLGAREVETAFYPDPRVAAGGARAAVWDHRMPPEASALTLLAASEFLRSLAAAEEAKTPPAR